jgi:hypothetical protein
MPFWWTTDKRLNLSRSRMLVVIWLAMPEVWERNASMPKLACALISAGLAMFAAASAAGAATCSDPNSISKVRNRVPSGPYEYVVFNFIKPPTVPSYTVKRVSPLFIQDGSGNPVTIAGSKFREIRFTGVVWTCSINEIFNLPKQAIKGIASTGQFEGIITYVAGYRNASRFVDSYSYDAGSIRKIVLRFRK